MADLECAPDSALGHGILLRSVRGGVLAANASTVAERGEFRGRELASVVRAEASGRTNSTDVRDEFLHLVERVGLAA